MLEVRNLTGQRDERRLFHNLNFKVRPQEILCIRGHNGAGKTTLLQLLSGLSRPENGQILWNGASIRDSDIEYTRMLVYIGHENGIKGDLTIAENLHFARALHGNPSGQTVQKVLEQLGIDQYAQVPCRYLSAGQKRRAALARLLVSKSRLWLLDEPFTALDESAQQIVVDLIAEHLQAGGVCVATSHQPIDRNRFDVRELNLGEKL